MLFSPWPVATMDALEQFDIHGIAAGYINVVVWQAIHGAIEELRMSNKQSVYATCIHNRITV